LLGHDIDSNYGSAAWEAADMYMDRATYVVALACFVHDPPSTHPAESVVNKDRQESLHI